MSKRGYKDLFVWREAVAFIPDVYAVASTFPAQERFALSDQIRRAAVAIPANIAEGQARYYPREFLHHLRIARGSLAEVHTLFVVAEQVGYIGPEILIELEETIAAIGRPLNRLILILQRRIKSGEAFDDTRT